jgi:hypothetical protein
MDGGSDIHELPLGTVFALDFATFEAGYMTIGPQGPVRLMKPYIMGTEMPPQPQERDDKGQLIMKPGFRCVVAGNALEGIREWCSNAASVVGPLDDLWNTWWYAPEAAQGKIPLVSIVSTTPVTTGGKQKSTNYKPNFVIKGWVDRLEKMGPRTVPLPNGAIENGNGTNGHEATEKATKKEPDPAEVLAKAEQLAKAEATRRAREAVEATTNVVNDAMPF